MDEEILGTDEIDDIWSDVDVSDVEDDEDAIQEEADQREPEKVEKKPAEVAPEPAKEEPKIPQMFKVKHLGEEKEVTYEDAPTYIQKGMDYDRIRAKYDEAASVKTWLEDVAKAEGLTVEALIQSVNDHRDEAKAQALVDGGKASDITIARERIKLERERQALNAEREASEKSKKAAEDEKQAMANRAAQEWQEFHEEYPKILIEDLPKEVSGQLGGKKTMLQLYVDYQQKQERAAIEAEKKNLENKQKSTGPKASSGNSKVDEFIRIFDSD